MKTSENIADISAALAKAQGEMKNPEKNRTARIPTKAGGSYEYNYADLPATFDCVRSALAKNGLSHTAATTYDNMSMVISVRLLHTSGQWIEASAMLPSTQDPKMLAANLTYLRRYLFNGLVGIAGDDDLDSDPENEKAKYEERRQSSRPAEAPATPMGPRPAPAGLSMDCPSCRHPMMISKKNPNDWYCMGCKVSRPRQVVA